MAFLFEEELAVPLDLCVVQNLTEGPLFLHPLVPLS